jgi:hypothetical protein
LPGGKKRHAQMGMATYSVLIPLEIRLIMDRLGQALAGGAHPRRI